MKYTILFPSDYFDITKIDETYMPEFQEGCKIPELNIAFYNHDKFIYEDKLEFYPKIKEIDKGVCICRTWMLKQYEYEKLYDKLLPHDIKLINSPEEYIRMHLFPLIYPEIEKHTPKTIFFDDIKNINIDLINASFTRFMIKDYVKSVKEHDFPKYFETPVTYDELKIQVEKFIELRGSLFTGGIVFKKYVNLKKYGSVTNEYRVFYLNGEIITISINSNQPDNCPYVPQSFADKFKNLPSNYYTVDFAELDNGDFTILETGDGQVSGLSPNQYIFKYYDEIRRLPV